MLESVIICIKVNIVFRDRHNIFRVSNSGDFKVHQSMFGWRHSQPASSFADNNGNSDSFQTDNI